MILTQSLKIRLQIGAYRLQENILFDLQIPECVGYALSR